MDLPAPVDAATIVSGLQASDITAIAGVFVAVCALFATTWQAWFTRRHAITSVKPFINLSPFNNADSKSDTFKFELSIQNMGLGPAKVTKIHYFLDRNPHGGNLKSLIKKTPLESFSIIHSYTFLDMLVLNTNSSLTLLGIETALENMEHAQIQASRIDVLIEYTDMYNTPQTSINSIDLKTLAKSAL